MFLEDSMLRPALAFILATASSASATLSPLSSGTKVRERVQSRERDQQRSQRYSVAGQSATVVSLVLNLNGCSRSSDLDVPDNHQPVLRNIMQRMFLNMKKLEPIVSVRLIATAYPHYQYRIRCLPMSRLPELVGADLETTTTSKQ